jgi:capsular exopolysaccharide synthesis family protein
MIGQLTILNGPLKNAIFPLPTGGLHLLGQGAYCDVQLPDRALDAYHCAFVRGTEADEDQYQIVDLYTQNGTRVNGVSVSKAALRHGCGIVIGETKMRFDTVTGERSGPSPLPPGVALALLDSQERQQRRARAGVEGAGGVRAELVPVRGASTADRLALSPAQPLYFGRGRGTAVLLSDPGASRHQCLVAYDVAAGEFVLYDLRTTNGTLLNGERIERAPLHDRDHIQLGNETEFVFLDLPVRTAEKEDLGETRDLSHVTLLVRHRRAKKPGLRGGRRPVRSVRPEPTIREDDTGTHVPIKARTSAAHPEGAAQESKATRDKKARSDKGTAETRFPVAVGKTARGIFAEAYRTLRTNLDLTSTDGLGRCIVVTSPGPQEGKTSVTVNLGIAAANIGLKVVLLEGDLRQSRLHRVFLLQARPGLVNYLAKGAPSNGYIRETHVKNLWVIPRGSRPANPGELLHSAGLADLIEDLREHYDLIVIDTPPMLTVSDALVLSPLVDGYLLVARSGKTPRQAAKMAIQQIQRAQGTVLGVVLNDLNPKRHGYSCYRYPRYEY